MKHNAFVTVTVVREDGKVVKQSLYGPFTECEDDDDALEGALERIEENTRKSVSGEWPTPVEKGGN